MMRTLIITLSIAFFASCAQEEQADNAEKYKTELEQIDELRVQVREAKKVYLAVDTVTAKKAAAAYDKNTRLLGQYYTADSIDTTFAKIMTSYKVLKGGKGLYQARTKISNEIKFTMKNLNALEENIVAGKFSDDKIDQYLKEETVAVEQLVTMIENSSKAANKAAEAFEELNPKVEEVVEEYKKKSEK